MTTNNLLITASVDSSRATKGISDIISHLTALQQELVKLSKGQEAADLNAVARQYQDVYGPKLRDNIRQATIALKQFEEIQNRQRTRATGPGAGFIRAVRQDQKGFGPQGTLGAATPSQNELADATARATSFLREQIDAFQAIRAEMDALAQEAPIAYQNLILSQQQSLQLEQQLQAILGGGSAVEATLLRRRDIIDQTNRELEEQRAALEAANRAGLAKGVERKLTAGLANIRQQKDLLEQVAKIDGDILTIEGEIAALRGQAAGSLFDVVPESQDELGKVLDKIKATGSVELGDEEAQRLSKINDLYAKQADLRTRATAKGVQGKLAQEELKVQQALSGQLPALEEIERRQAALLAQRQNLFTPTGLQSVAPELLTQISLLHRLAVSLNEATEGTAKFDEIQRQIRQTIDEVNQTAEEGGTGAVITALDPETLKASVEASMSGMQRLFQGVFSDLGRRFTATLQFAISAAILFGVQRFVREFFQTVIEVERAFADIETALALDIDAERGTVAFRRQVEEIRQDVLRLADEFNVLPTEANEAAFKMVARFQDMGNAMLALRSQLLATKVSTIEQGEVLRALTAVAEGFAAAQLEVNEGLTLQERLLKRETVAARGYGEALDLAVHIQQKFGIEVEDTLEGTARATEVFRQMGFTLAETQAIVAATGFRLGQTGVQAAERLVRSIGQLTDPKIRNALLDLAAASEEFQLATSDFDSGAKAWKAIVDQFSRLEKVDPGAARQILQIIGQRRELEAVAAALGTADLQEGIVAGQIEAIGAAEERFSFLEKTASETLKSIAAGFQELAQNFERLGGLASVKLFLSALDEILNFINETLKLVIDLFDAFDDWLGVDFTGTTRAIISVAAALALALKIAKELRVTFLALTGTQFGTRMAQLFAGFFAASAGATGAIARGVSLGTGGVAAAGTVAAKGGILAKLGITAGLAAGGLGLIVGAAALVVLSLKALDDKTKALAESFKAGNADVLKATVDAVREIRALGLDRDDPEAQTIIHQAQLDAAKAWAQGAQNAKPGVLEVIGAAITDPSGVIAPRFFDTGNFADVRGRENFPEEFEGGSEFWTARVIELDGFLIQDLVDALKQDLQDLDLTPEQISDIRSEGIQGLPEGRIPGKFAFENEADLVKILMDRIDLAIIQLDEDFGSNAANATRNANIRANVGIAAGIIDEVFQVAGLFADQINRSINSLLAENEKLDRDVTLGRRHPGTVPGERKRIAGELLKEAEALKISPSSTPEEVASAFANADRVLIQSAQDFIDVGDAILAQGASSRTEMEQRALRILINSERIRRFTADRRFDLVHEAQIVLDEDIKAETIAELTAAITLASQAKALAVTLTERQLASNQLSIAIRNLASFWRRFGDEEAANAEVARAIQEERARRQELNDQLNKSFVAAARRSGPILSPTTQLKAQILQLRQAQAEAARLGDFGTVAEIGIQLDEAAAQGAQLELRKITAAAKARAGARDALELQGVSLGALVAEQRLVARIMGNNSVEWHDLQTAIKSAQAQLLDMVLELEAINRTLGGDLTNPLTQAENAFIEMSRRLQLVNQEGGGELEVARAQLEKEQAEVNLERARFDTALFDLKFLSETGKLGTGGYISALQALLEQVDTSTHQGQAIWIQINDLIQGLTDDIGDLGFNIPGSIRIPTLFEVRRAVQADSLGVNYIDNRQIDVRVNVQAVADMEELLKVLSGSLQQTIPVEGQRLATGNAGLTVGPFN